MALWGQFTSCLRHSWSITFEKLPTYNPVVHQVLSRQFPQALWKRIAALLSFLAVVSALIAPASMLAEEVRTGKLGGICLVNNAVDASGDTAPAGSHCDLCGSLAFALPSFALQPLPSQPCQHVAGVLLSFDLAARISGLPPSRGPPAL